MIWEDIGEGLSRTRTPLGWLVMSTDEVWHDIDGTNRYGFDWRRSVTFVLDPFHAWKVKVKA